jgi:iron complex transport system permease protein
MSQSAAQARRLPAAPVLAALGLFLFVCIISAVAAGDTRLPAAAVARSLGHHLLPTGWVGLPRDQPSPLDPTVTLPGAQVDAIVWSLRLPRVFLAALVGASLSVAGLALQGLLGNPLADPYIIGVSSGAAVGAGIGLLLGIGGALGGLGLPLCGFAAAVATMALVFSLARSGGRLHTATFLLAGIVAGSFLWAVMTLLLSLAGAEQREILNWLMGRFSDADWGKVALLAPFTLAGIAALIAAGRGLDAFSFGEDTARSVGVEVERFKAGILTLAALLTALSVSVSGIIGFVGLIVPHAARALVGPPHRVALPVAALLGASLTVLADLLARTVLPGTELPVGVVTAILGAPFFFVLLRRQMGS